MQVLSSLTDVIMESMDIIGLNHQVTYDIMVDKFDVNSRDKITKLCKNNNLIWHVIPYPYVSISKKYDDINKEYYRTEKIGARIVFEDQEQTEYVEPSINEYELDMSDVK